MNEDLRAVKQEFRIRALAARDNIPESVRAEQSRAITGMILQTELYEKARYILSYVSFGSEVDTRELIRRAVRDQKRVYIPRIMDEKRMEFFEIQDLSSLKRNSFGILEPEPDPVRLFPYNWHLSLDRAEECVVLVPGLAFDEKLHRIGYGRGYYDRFLAGFRKKMSIALAFNEQIADDVPVRETDEPVDLIVTQERAYF